MRLTFDDALPISGRRDDIADALARHQVVVVAGETGSGKTTQLPKIALQLGARSIAHTQPRRIAARSVATRIAAECEVELGAEVGYAVRFDEKRRKDTAVSLMTDGLLLAEINSDRDLRRYDTIIVDEAHERSLAIDFLLGYLRELLPRRPDLKVIVTSATIDVERFAELFDAPVIEVSGRTFPVELRYRPMADGEDGDQAEAIASAITELPRDGDVLVFLSGEREIRDTAEHLSGLRWPRTEVLPLYGRLSAQDQQKIFSSHLGRRIVLATNVAETSLTVPGIRYVVDPGYARISRYSQRLKVQRLPIEPVSQASAQQRAGRCGRVADGICIRLYSEEDFDSRPLFTDPEIRRTNLASVLLQMASLDLGDVDDFGFLDPPEHRAVADGRALLAELGALVTGRDGRPRLTRLGRTMSSLPVDPRHARQIIAADRLGCLADVLVIVAGLSIQDPRERPLDKQQQADEKHARFRQPDSDFLSWLSLWTYLREQRDAGSHSRFRRMCRDEFLHYLRVREWHDVHSQLRRSAQDLGMKPGRAGADPDLVHQALLSGLLSHIGLREPDGREFVGARNARFMVFPGSGLAKKPPRWVMAAELVETTRLWARTAARIDPAWVEKAGEHLLKRQYAEPHWSARRGAAMAKERATLYGVPVVVDRLVPLSRSDKALARELFVRHALVDGEWRTNHRFWQRNQRLVAELEELEDRVRRRGLGVDDQVLFDFYDRRVPADVVSVRHFDSWWKKQRQETPDLLDLDRATLLSDEAGEIEEQFPTTWSTQSGDYDVTYVFEPGRVDDGVVVDVPVTQLPSLAASDFAGNVPGHRRELVTELLRSLPKPLRRTLVPIPQTVDALLPTLDPTPPLADALATAVRARTGERVTSADFDWAGLPPHLRVTFRVTDDDGSELARDADPDALRERLRPRLRAELDEAAQDTERTGITGWDVGTLEPEVTVGQATGYPTLVDEGSSVALRVLHDPAEQRPEMIRGHGRLLALTIPSTGRRIVDGLDLRQRLTLASTPYPSVDALVEDCRLAALEELLVRHGGPVRDAVSFEAMRTKVRADVHDVTERLVHDVLRATESLGQVTPQGAAGGPDSAEDVRVQLTWLVFPGFVRDSGAAAVRRYPAYLQAAKRRLQRPMDQAGVNVVDLESRFHELTADLSVARRRADDVRHVRWALEELRVGTFAQGLGTAFPVSLKRVTTLLDDLGATLQT